MPEKVRLDFWMADLRLVVSMAGLTTQKPRGRVSSWVLDGTGVALVALTGRIGLMETTCIQCSLLAVGDSGVLSISVMT